MSRWILIVSLLLAGCPEPVGPPPIVPDDDDDSTVGDDDDSGDDDDTTPGDDDDDDDDDDSTPPPGLAVSIQADVPPGASLFTQDGEGDWLPLTVTDMAGELVVEDGDGRFGVLLACAGSTRATIRAHFGDATIDPTAILACPEDLDRMGTGGTLSGSVVGAEDNPWYLFIGSKRWLGLSPTLSPYVAYMEEDNYDLIAQRFDSFGAVNKQLIRRVLDASDNPGVSIDFWDDASGFPHTPEDYALDVQSDADAVDTRATWLTRGGTPQALSSQSGLAPTWSVISNERRFDDEVFITDTVGAYTTCWVRTLAIIDSLRSLDYPAQLRHQTTLVPVTPLTGAACADIPGPAVSAAAGLSIDWTGGVTGSGPQDGYRTVLKSGAERWIVTAAPTRPVVTIATDAVVAATGAAHTEPAAGWTWDASTWSLPAGTPAAAADVVLDTDLFQTVPLGRVRFRFDRPTGARGHEYEEDDLTRPVIVLPWTMDDWAAAAVGRSGAL